MSLLYEFTANKETKTIHITREFAASLELVWDAWTKPEILDQWFAPKPFRAETKEMDFREGGRWIYSMVSPENTVRGYSLTEFIRIDPRSSFHTRNSFCDENGNPINNVFSLTTNSFRSRGEITTVHIEKKFDDLAALETMITMGYKEGLAMALSNLDEYFLSLVTSN